MSKVIEIATLEIGVTEFPSGSNNVKYNTWFYGKEVRDGIDLKGKPDPKAKYPWCCTFEAWCYHNSGSPLPSVGWTRGYASCPYALTNLKKWGRMVTIPKPGDIVFFDWNGDGIFDHTGIFVRDLGKGLFESIEGNTAFDNDSNGGMVMKRADRKYKNAIFIRPNVAEKENPLV